MLWSQCSLQQQTLIVTDLFVYGRTAKRLWENPSKDKFMLLQKMKSYILFLDYVWSFHVLLEDFVCVCVFQTFYTKINLSFNSVLHGLFWSTNLCMCYENCSVLIFWYQKTNCECISFVMKIPYTGPSSAFKLLGERKCALCIPIWVASRKAVAL